MPLTLTNYATDTANYNCYCEVADLAVIKQHLLSDFTEFESQSVAVQEKYLYASSKKLDTYYFLKGYKKSSTQNMEFPRSGVYIGNSLISSLTIPDDIKIASALIALQIFESGVATTSSVTSAIKSESIGKTLKIEYDNEISVDTNGSKYLELNAFIKPYLGNKYTIGRA